MDPHTRRFELLQLEFDSHTATVSDITDQIAISATEPSLQGQQFDKNGLVTLKGTTLESGKKVGAYVDAGCAAIVIAVPADSMNGSEDQCVVLLDDRNSRYLESISRGRNLLVVVTTRGEG